MFFILVFIFAGTATLSAIDSVSTGDYGGNSARTNAEVFRQEVFTLAAQRYMAAYPASTNQLSWAQVKAKMPPSFASGSYSSDFKVKVVASPKYVVCGRLKTDAAVNIAMQRQSNFYTKALGDGFFASATDEATLNTYASQCKA